MHSILDLEKTKIERLQTFMVNIGILKKGKKIMGIDKTENEEEKKGIILWLR